MEQPAPSIQHPSPLKYIVALLGGLCIVAMCLPSLSKLIIFYQEVSTVRGFVSRDSIYDYNQYLYSPDLSSILAFNSQTGKGLTWDYATQRITYHINLNPASYPVVAWSPDQRYLLYGRELPDYQTALDLWDLAGQKKIFSITESYDMLLERAVWSPDNTRIVLLDHDGELTFRDAATGKVLAQHQRAGDDNMVAVTVAWSPDSRYIALAKYAFRKTSRKRDNRALEVSVMDTSTWHIVSDAFLPFSTTDRVEGMHLAWSPDGKSIATSFGQQLWLLNPFDSTKARRFNAQSSPYEKAALIGWSPDSTQFAVFGQYGQDGKQKELAVWRIADLQKIKAVEQDALEDGIFDNIVQLYWSPKTQHIIFITKQGSQESFPWFGW